MAEDSAASKLRLSSARRRIDAFIEQIDILAASSFPHDDGEEALAAIRANCKELQQDLKLPPGVTEALVDQLCLTLLDKVSNFTEILGFILRSTNVRNPFELHYIVKKLVRKALGEEVGLLISSEWSYVPFTYPMNADQLPDSILIGTPAPEASNPLLISLAGHEVGHSAWRLHACTLRYTADVTEAVKKELETNTGARKRLLESARLGALDQERVINQCADYAMQQLEEVFCDLFGLFLFGHAFVAAFDYLLGPGGYDRDLAYPSDQQRMAILVAAAPVLAIDLDPEITGHWNSSHLHSSSRPTAEIVDAVTATMLPTVQKDLFELLHSRGLRPPKEDVIARVLESFQRGEPHPERVELGEIVSAGWHHLRSLDVSAFPRVDEEEQHRNRVKSYKVLADLVLKTVEVAEYHDRIAGDA